LIRFGEVRRGTLGLVVQDLSADLAGAFGLEQGRGALVAEVVEESAATAAGLQPGDVITSLAGRRVGSAQDFLNAEGQVPVGAEVDVEYLREQRSRDAKLVIAEAVRVAGDEIDRRLAGAVFSEVPPSQRRGQSGGAQLIELARDSRLAFEGLRNGDVITGVNRVRVNGLSEFRAAMRNARGALLLLIRRNGETYIARID
jgi:serine protease Do/serine protease DegQ